MFQIGRLRSNQGKLIFYILSMHYATEADQSNYVMEYVRRKIGRIIDPPGSSGSTSPDRPLGSSTSTSGKRLQLTRGRTVPRGVGAFGNTATQ